MVGVVIIFIALLAATCACVRAFLDHRCYGEKIAKLEREVAAAERLLRLRGALANEVAHEIKSPITAILCSAETLDLLLGEKLAPEHRQAIHYIKEYGNNLLRLVCDFLDLSVAEGGELRHQTERVGVEMLVRSTLDLLRSNAQRKKLSIQLDFPEELLYCEADPRHLKHILFNLVHNAIKYTPQQGQIQIAARQDFPHPRIKVWIKDNGVGIPAEQLGHLFDQYARYSGDEPRERRGVGLGLPLCKSLLEAAGGEIIIQSTVGVGTSIELLLPAAQSPQKEDRSDLKPIGGPRPLVGQSFLVVDGDYAARETIAALIEAWGGLVDRVGDATAALKALAGKDYAAVMVDHDLENGGGHELARVIKGDVGQYGTTVILTASSREHEAGALRAGIDEYLEKPLNGKKLLTSLLRTGACRIPQ